MAKGAEEAPDNSAEVSGVWYDEETRGPPHKAVASIPPVALRAAEPGNAVPLLPFQIWALAGLEKMESRGQKGV